MAARKTKKSSVTPLTEPKGYMPLPRAQRPKGLKLVQAEVPDTLYEACSAEAKKRTLSKRQMLHYGLECFLAACNPTLAKKIALKA